MPIVDGKDISPDEAMHRGLCPECGTAVTPRTARAHADDHWGGRTPSPEGQRRYDMLRDFSAGSRTDGKIERSPLPKAAAQPNDKPVKTFLDYVALALILEAGAAFWRGENLGRVVAGLVGGGAVLAAHYKWDWLTEALGDRFASIARTVAADFRWWLVPLLLLFVYVGAPTFLVNVRQTSATPALRPSSNEAIREHLATFIAQSEDMLRTCLNRYSTVPDVPQWKATVEQYLASLGRSYVIRFRDGTSNIGPPASDLDLAHTACWMDLHQRNSNLETFFLDFPRN